MMILVPALGVPGEEMLQDTLKSMLVAFFALAASFAFFWFRRKSEVALNIHKLLYLPLGLMAYALLSMAWSHAYLGGVEAIRWFLFSLILLLGMNTLTLGRVTCLLWGIHLGAVLASLWAALQFWLDFKFFAQGPNPASTFVNRNFLGEFLVCTLPFSALLLTRLKAKTSVFLVTLSLGFTITALLMTGTRSALVGLLLLSVILPTLLFRYPHQIASTGWRLTHRVALVALLLTTILAMGAINTANPQLIAEHGRGDALDRALKRSVSMAKASEYSEGSFSIRTLIWKATTRMIQANPVSGVGAGAWEVQVPLYQEAGSQQETEYYAHNELLQLVAEYGLVGWLFLACLLSYLGWTAYTTWSDQSDQGQQEAPLRAVTLVSLLVFLLVSSAGFPWRMASTGALFALSLALLAASDARLGARKRRLIHTVQWKTHHSAWALSVTVLCAALAVYLAQQAAECESKLVRAIKIARAISQSGRPNAPHWNRSKTEMLRLVHEGIAINPHYRKLTPAVADQLANWGDWGNAIRIWESVLASRPHVVIFSINLARAYREVGNDLKARSYFDRAVKLQPNTPAVLALQADFLIQDGRYPQAAQIIRQHLDTNTVDNDLTNSAYVLGQRTHHWELVIRALELRIKKRPDEASTAWLHLGNIYSQAEVNDEARALDSYRAALRSAPSYAKRGVLDKIPAPYREKLQTATLGN